MSRAIRLAFVLLAVTLLAGGAAQAMPLGAPPQATAPQGLLDAAWSWIVDLFVDGGDQDRAAAWDKAGCEMDPNGLPILGGAAAATALDPSMKDAGIEMDPNG